MTPTTIADIQALMQADSALLAQVQTSASSADAASVISKAALAKGINVDAAELTAYMSSPASAAMTDAELEQVAGGVDLSNVIDFLFPQRTSFNLGATSECKAAAQAKERFNDRP